VRLAGHSMGAALALLVAAERPEAVERLVLVAPAGLPLRKPFARILLTSLGQACRGLYPPGELVRIVLGVAVSPRCALRLARTVHGLDLTAELLRVRDAGVRSTVVACTSDELTPASHCRRLAELLGAAYRELDAPGGHVWMLARPALLRAELALELRERDLP